MAASKRRRSAHDSSLFDYRNLEPRHLLSVSLPGGVNLVSNSTLTPLAESDTNLYSNEEVEGWNAVNAEAGQQLHLLKFPHEREFVLNLDATAGHFDQVFQDLATREGIEYTLAFDLRERPVAVDAAESTNDVEVFWNDESLGTFRGTQQWQTVALTVTGRADMSRLEFREVGQDEQDLGDGRGPLIDNVIATRMHTGFVANGSFELVADKSGELHHQSTVDGWQAMGSYDDRVMKIVQSAEATEGAGVLALDSSAERLDRLYQDLATEPDRQYYLSFDIKGADEPGMDNELRIRWNGQWAGSFVGTSDWQTYGLLLEADSELTRLVLRETAGGEMGKGDGYGPLLDNIRIDKVDQLPQIPAIADAVITQGEDFRLDIAASDPDGTPLTYEITGSGDPLNGDSSQPYISPGGGVLWWPGRDGMVDLTVTATDNFGVPVTHDFSLTVERNADVPADFEPFSGQRQLSNVKPELRNGLYDQAPQMSIDTAKEYEAIFQTADGQIRVLLNDDQAPITVNNFVNLALDGYYDGLTFHRVVDLGPGFIAQGGDPTGFGAGGPGYQFADEATALGEFDRRDLLAMANAGPNTNGSQFFFTLSPQTQLNGQHAIFGEVIEGSDVVDAINRRVVGSTTPAEQIYSVSIFEDGTLLENPNSDFQGDIEVNFYLSTDTTYSNPLLNNGFNRSDNRTFYIGTIPNGTFPTATLKNWNYGQPHDFCYLEHYRYSVNNNNTPRFEDITMMVKLPQARWPAGEMKFQRASLALNSATMQNTNPSDPNNGFVDTKTGDLVYFFDFTTAPAEFKNQLNTQATNNFNPGIPTELIKQFTFVPYYPEVENSGYYNGKSAFVLTFGPQDYEINTINNSVDPKTTYELSVGQIKSKQGLGWQEKPFNGVEKSVTIGQGAGQTTYYCHVGGIADRLLNMSNSNGYAPTVADQVYHLNIDGEVDTSNVLLSQSILITTDKYDPVNPQKVRNWMKPILLENSKQWIVTGGSEGLVNGTAQFNKYDAYNTDWNNNQRKHWWQFENQMLDLQSSSDTGDHRSIAVAGVTFKNNPKRNQSGIQLNAYNNSVDWWSQNDYPWDPASQTHKIQQITDQNTMHGIWESRLTRAVDNFISNNWTTQFVGAKGKVIQNGSAQTKTCGVWMFDNQMFTFSDGSDGPETLAANSHFERNYQMTADDNLKALSNNSEWVDMTLIQGNTGSAVSFASYGITNGPVYQNKLNTVSIPRICQATTFDDMNGVISNKSVFGKDLQDSSHGGIFDNQFNEVKVHSWERINHDTGKSEGNQNLVCNTGVYSALWFNDNWPGAKSSPGTYSLGGPNTNFEMITIPQKVFLNQTTNEFCYAFGDNSKTVYYSGWGTWYAADGTGGQKIPDWNWNTPQTTKLTFSVYPVGHIPPGGQVYIDIYPRNNQTVFNF